MEGLLKKTSYIFEIIYGSGLLMRNAGYNVIFSSSLGRIKGTPSSLGSAMIFLGLFYILSILLIPAYLNSQKISFLSYSPPG